MESKYNIGTYRNITLWKKEIYPGKLREFYKLELVYTLLYYVHIRDPEI
jgi:hypothetical protein